MLGVVSCLSQGWSESRVKPYPHPWPPLDGLLRAFPDSRHGMSVCFEFFYLFIVKLRDAFITHTGHLLNGSSTSDILHRQGDVLEPHLGLAYVTDYAAVVADV